MSAATDRYTHFIPTGSDAIAEALELGTPITSACGKLWVPSRDPDAYYLCPECLHAICEWWAA